jgi:hypothetical protein
MAETTPLVTKDAALARLAEIREHLAPVKDMQSERLWLLMQLADTYEVPMADLTEADGSLPGAVRTSLSKARRVEPEVPERYRQTAEPAPS